MSNLEEQVRAGRLQISAETLSMSVSELMSLHREGTLEIRPEFQRLFRWSGEQKSRLVESILLGIPLPSIFVAQTEGGGWELVDGLQRMGTLLELQGLLPDPNGGGLRSTLCLSGTLHLPALEGVTWDGRDCTPSLSDAQKLDIRLARLDVKILKRSSDAQAKYDLFQRLNSFGSTLTAQEIRSALIAGQSSECLSWLLRLASRESFKALVALGEKQKDEQYDLELLLRFLMLHNHDASRASLTDFSARLDRWSSQLAQNWKQESGRLEIVFNRTFDLLLERGGEDVFRRWDSVRNRHRGPFLNTAFEVLAMGAGYHVDRVGDLRSDVVAASRDLWTSELETGFATGRSTEDRLSEMLPLGRRMMSPGS